uniref:FLZ-type domain-containing protein n=1 Tax=Lactuca sativa TaxID=4236 RepID=A0A9R1WZF4_LACSA|nr:hypothetical protein LSAT_V11C700353190 [Lactuca sativa]
MKLPVFSNKLFTTTGHEYDTALFQEPFVHHGKQAPKLMLLFPLFHLQYYVEFFIDSYFSLMIYIDDTTFCSDECRTEQVDRDEAKDSWTVSISLKSMRKKDQKEQLSSNTSAPSSQFLQRRSIWVVNDCDS